MSKADISPTPIRSRRAVLAGIAVTAALPISGPAAAAQTLDADLIELGARLEPLVDRYYAARECWAGLMLAAHAEHDRTFGSREVRGYSDPPEVTAAFAAIRARIGLDKAGERLSAVFEAIEPLSEAINAAPVNSIEGLRAKAMVALWKVAPDYAGTKLYSFDNAFPFQQLFTAVAELCGLKEKLEATGCKLRDLSLVDTDEEEEA